MEYEKEVFNEGGYLFLQSIYYQLRLDRICRKIRDKSHFEYDINAIFSDLVYTRILEPSSKRSSYKATKKFLEVPSYELHDVYRALSLLADNCDLIQSEVYKNSNFILKRNDNILYYDCTNYYFEIEQVSLKPLEQKGLQDFGHQTFIYCSDAGLASEGNQVFNHMDKRAFIVT